MAVMWRRMKYCQFDEFNHDTPSSGGPCSRSTPSVPFALGSMGANQAMRPCPRKVNRQLIYQSDGLRVLGPGSWEMFSPRYGSLSYRPITRVHP
jgi:hypothetical protein